jgi:hypothetical protein
MQKAEKINMPRRHRGLVMFLALLDQIRDRLEKGWLLIDIYEAHADALGVSYSQFARYVATHIRGKESKTRRRAKEPASQARPDDATAQSTETPPRAKGPIITTARETKRFIFDPTAAHRRKDELF